MALVRGGGRTANLRLALELIEEDIHLERARCILIKPNLTSAGRALAVTPVEAVRAVLAFIRERSSAQVIVADGSGTGSASTATAFRRFGYLSLAREPGVELRDLNQDASVPFTLRDASGRLVRLRLARTVLEADYRISLTPPKTHDCVIVSASIKNIVMGSLVRREGSLAFILALANAVVARLSPLGLAARAPGFISSLSGNDKMKVHQGYATMHLLLSQLASLAPPHLAIIDGYVGMEGNGPVFGQPVPWDIAIASTDFLAADTLAAWLMGFEPETIGYLRHCREAGLGQGDIGQMEVLGERPEACRRPFQPHPSYPAQLKMARSEPPP